MKAQELRIGNWIHIGGMETEVYELCYDVLTTTLDKGQYEYIYEVVEPIPITSEWVERFGGTDAPNVWSSKNELVLWFGGPLKPYMSISFSRITNKCFLQTAYQKEGDELHSTEIALPIEYIHQLQNLYFALTGSELNYNA